MYRGELWISEEAFRKFWPGSLKGSPPIQSTGFGMIHAAHWNRQNQELLLQVSDASGYGAPVPWEEIVQKTGFTEAPTSVDTPFKRDNAILTFTSSQPSFGLEEVGSANDTEFVGWLTVDGFVLKPRIDFI